MQCPKCSGNDLKIDVSFTGQVACKFPSDEGFELIDRVVLDSQWDDDSTCECLNCDWYGTVRSARSGLEPGSDVAVAETVEVSGPVTADELLDLKRRLQSERCSAALRMHVERVMGELERLSSLLDMVSRISQKSTSSDGDTVIA